MNLYHWKHPKLYHTCIAAMQNPTMHGFRFAGVISVLHCKYSSQRQRHKGSESVFHNREDTGTLISLVSPTQKKEFYEKEIRSFQCDDSANPVSSIKHFQLFSKDEQAQTRSCFWCVWTIAGCVLQTRKVDWHLVEWPYSARVMHVFGFSWNFCVCTG